MKRFVLLLGLIPSSIIIDQSADIVNACALASINIAPLLFVFVKDVRGHRWLSLLLLGTRYGCLVVAGHVLS